MQSEIVEYEFDSIDADSSTGKRNQRTEKINGSPRLAVLLNRLRLESVRALPGAEPLKIFVQRRESHGASCVWGHDYPRRAPLVLFSIGPTSSSDHLEHLLAHEIAHGIVCASGISGVVSLRNLSNEVADEINSTAQHPWVFSLLDQAGYRDEQRLEYGANAVQELSRLQSMSTAEAGIRDGAIEHQIWSAVWTFNFHLLCPNDYRSIRKTIEDRLPSTFALLTRVETAWKNAGTQRDWMARTQRFHSLLIDRLRIGNYFRLGDREAWRSMVRGESAPLSGKWLALPSSLDVHVFQEKQRSSRR